MVLEERVQREGCSIQIGELLRRMEQVEKHNLENQDEKIMAMDKMIMRLELMSEKQNETNKMIFDKQAESTKFILDQFDAYRRENIEIGKQRDAVVKELSDNMLQISDGMQQMNQKMGKNDRKFESIDQKLESIDEKSKIDFMAILKTVLIGAITAALITAFKMP